MDLNLAFAFSIQAYGALPLVFDASISPNGTRAAMARNESDGTQLAVVIDIAGGQVIRGVTVGSVSHKDERPLLRKIRFADDHRLAYLLQATFAKSRALPEEAIALGQSHMNWWHTSLLDISTGKSLPITRDESVDWGLSFTGLISPIDGQPNLGRISLDSSPYRGGTHDVYDVNLTRGKTSLHTKGTINSQEYAFDASCQPVARLDVDDKTNQWQLYALERGRARQVAPDTSATGESGFSGVTASGQSTFIRTVDDGNFFHLTP